MNRKETLMGCDIHAFIERRQKTTIAHNVLRWEFVMSDRNLDSDWGGRNYARFARLAGVRGEGPAAKGLPEGLSDPVKSNYEEWGSDAHNESWTEFWEALTIWIETDYEVQYGSGPHRLAGVAPEVQSWQMFGHVPEPGYDYRIVYWFDN